MTDLPRPEPATTAAESLVFALTDARRLELELFAGLADDGLLGEKGHFLEPPIWELGHVAWFQEYWLLRHLAGAEPLLPGSDGIYDSFNVSYRLRWDHAYPTREETLRYCAEVLRRSVERLAGRAPDERETYFYTLATLHEDMHAENLTLILHTLGARRPRLSAFQPAAARPPVDESFHAHDVQVPGARFLLGARRDEPFFFDNETWAHPVEVKPFCIAATAVTNREFEAFVEDGGYARRELWSARGWDFRRRAGITQPLFWVRDPAGWSERHFDSVARLRPFAPVSCVSWFEADAFCRWAHRRLPTEAEWELAATFDPRTGQRRRYPWGAAPPSPAQANLDYRAGGTIDVRALPAGDSPAGCRQMIGNVWEWVEDTFAPYPGFERGPYKEYSEPYFGKKKVLKGGAWTTRSRLIRPGYRNFYLHKRRNIFAGFRTCALRD